MFDGPSGFDVAVDQFATIFRPRRPLGIAAWAGKYRKLSSKTAAEKGPWRNERIPFLVGIMNALDDRHPAHTVVFKKSSQVGGSECGLNWIGQTIHQQPRSMLALFATEKDSKKWSKTKLGPMLKDTPELRRIIPPGRRGRPRLGEEQDDDEEKSTLLTKHYPNGVLFTGSTNVASDLASISVPLLYVDERDRMPKEIDEGDPIDLAMMRTANFSRRKIFIVSTPTTEDESGINPDWLAGTMDRYYVPCPDCKAMQYLRFENLKYPEGRPKEARYACEECGSLFEERHKTEMLAAGEWRATHPDREGDIKSFHINGLYTPIGLGFTWAQHAIAFERAKGKPAKMQAFQNTRMGEVVASLKIKLNWEKIKERAEPIPLRTIPAGYIILTCGVDVQKDRVEAQCVAWGRNERGWIADYQILEGDITKPEVWALLDAYLQKPIRNSFGIDIAIKCTIVDSAYATPEVINWTRTRGARNIYAGRGAKQPDRQPIGRPTLVDVKYRGQVAKKGAQQYQIGVSMLKALLYRRLEADAGSPDNVVLPSEQHYRFSNELREEYFRQLAAEEYKPGEGWVPTYERNEALDTLNYAAAASQHHSVNLHKLKDADWQQLESTYEPGTGKSVENTAAAGLMLKSGAMMLAPAVFKRR